MVCKIYSFQLYVNSRIFERAQYVEREEFSKRMTRSLLGTCNIIKSQH